MRMKAGALLALGSVALLTATALGPKRLVLVWNTSASVQIGLYVIVRRPLRIGDYVLVRLSGLPQALAERRNYVGPHVLLLKRVAAMEGDRVCRRGRVIWMSGQRRVIALGFDRGGRRLPVWQGCQHLQRGQLFVLGTHAESFDSRYFGPIDRAEIVGAAIPLFVLRA
ncbi:MAG: S26 family signal peptidase [Hyphomicrobium sp.]|uniref:S26 family signal peptidase n=1 Tax=Hyphomicrobium sp. TaxID=82 RepID=UPI001328F854|nr:S26 family signal peptidase [Hyphomicrobium sp.]KAB2943518.1 MAG: S26 family signal peptidase [Hyphomicrobium sp.]MBZ0209772.1 S26 family signal peptidase [Hyphomicrobium sp.]